MPSTYLTRTPSSETNRKTFTISTWCKFSATESMIISVGTDSSNRAYFMLSSDKIAIQNRDSGNINCQITTNRKLRDYNGWYHIVLAVDTTQATSSNRLKLYVNGEQETSFSTETYPPQNQNFHYNRNSQHYIGKNAWTSGNYFNGSMSHFHFIDGTAYNASAFGETDATTGEWKIKTSPSVTYGTNGFFILKDGNSVTDASPNSNNFTVAGGTLTKTEDNPSNVFATWNSLIKTPHQLVYSNGNTTTASGGNSWYSTQSTLGVTSGKWYWECKGLGADSMIGVASPTIDMNQSLSISQTGTTFFYNQDGGEMRKDASNTTADYGTLSTSDILGIAFDMDNKTITYYKNGVAFITNYAISTAITDTAMLSMNMYGGSNVINTNFGNGYFGTTAVTSAGTNASGNGIFEYDVPTGYTALSTKGLNL